MSAAQINKIHVASSTRLSLNDRFTAMASTGERIRRRSRSRSRSVHRDRAPINQHTSIANRRLLQQLSRKHKMQAALKLKRRSMRTVGRGVPLKRGTIKTLRVAPSGRTIRTNSLSKVATMRADQIINGNRRTPLRRQNSQSNIAGQLGYRRPTMGGAAERVAKRRLQLSNTRAASNAGGNARRGRSRSRSRVRAPEGVNIRGRSRSRGRSQSRTRREITGARPHIPIKARLGNRPNGRGINNNRRGGGVAQGRVEKKRFPNARNTNTVVQAGAGARVGRPRGRAAVKNVVVRSRSRSRRGSIGQQQQQRLGESIRGRRRTRSQQRNIRGGGAQRNGKNGANVQQQQQQRRGRSRSRGVRNGRGGVGGRNIGKNPQQQVNKDDLDKELDQYMATTKTENDMDYLLRN